MKKLTPDTGAGYYINAYNEGVGSIQGTLQITVSLINDASVVGIHYFNLGKYFRISGNHLGVALGNVRNLSDNYFTVVFFEFNPKVREVLYPSQRLWKNPTLKRGVDGRVSTWLI
jgi:hypothetical protein